MSEADDYDHFMGYDEPDEEFCLLHGYEFMRHEFGNPIAYCAECDDGLKPHSRGGPLRFAEEDGDGGGAVFGALNYHLALWLEGSAMTAPQDTEN